MNLQSVGDVTQLSELWYHAQLIDSHDLLTCDVTYQHSTDNIPLRDIHLSQVVAVSHLKGNDISTASPSGGPTADVRFPRGGVQGGRALVALHGDTAL